MRQGMNWAATILVRLVAVSVASAQRTAKVTVPAGICAKPSAAPPSRTRPTRRCGGGGGARTPSNHVIAGNH